MRSIIFPHQKTYTEIEEYVLKNNDFSTAELEYLFGIHLTKGFIQKYLKAGAIGRIRQGLYKNRFKQFVSDRVKRDKAIMEDLQ